MVVILLVTPSTTNGFRVINKFPKKDNKIRHITRINISDVYSQIELGSERTSADPITKEGNCHLKIQKIYLKKF